MPAWIRYVLLSSLVMACGSKKRVEPPAPLPLTSASQSSQNQSGEIPQGSGMALDGKVLYDDLCASCHGGLDQSTAARANAELIQSAMTNIAEMQGLPELKDEQVNSLVTALGKTPPGKGKNKP